MKEFKAIGMQDHIWEGVETGKYKELSERNVEKIVNESIANGWLKP